MNSKKLKTPELVKIKKELTQKPKPKKENKYYVLDLETESWNLAKKDLEKINMVFGVLTKFNKEFQIEEHKVFTANEVSNVLNMLFDQCYLKISFVYVHNLDFDFLFLLKPFLEQTEKYRIYPTIVGSRIISVKIMQKRVYFNKKTNQEETNWLTKVELRNSLCLISKSLKEIGKDLKLEKLESDYSFDSIKEQDIEYCKRDCEIVIRMLEVWYKTMVSLGITHPLEDLTLTSASCAFKVFKEKNCYIDEENKKVNPYALDSKEMNDEFRKWYFGGRTEVFDFNIAEKVSYYDINSLYPSVMIDCVIPKPPYIKTIEETPLTFAYEIEIDESKEYLPIFPERIDGKICFTAKKKHVFVFKEELHYLLEERIPFKIEAYWQCSEYGLPFSYIGELYKMRKQFEAEGNKGMASACKIIMNSTYGRFALITDREEIKLETFNVEHAEEYSEIIGNNCGVIKTETQIQSEINVVIAMKITALARLRITKEARNAIKRGFKVYYMDTDSIVVSQKAIPISKEIGGFKEEAIYDMFQAISAKDYFGFHDNKFFFKTKGVKIISFAEYLKYHLDSLQIARPIKLKELISLNEQEKLTELVPVQRKIIKKYLTGYNKRKINTDLSTNPIQENDIIEDIEEANRIKTIEILEKIAMQYTIEKLSKITEKIMEKVVK